MLRTLKIAALFFAAMVPFSSFGEECSLSQLWKKEKGAGVKIQMSPEGPGLVLSVLLKEYLGRVKGLAAAGTEATHLLTGKLSGGGGHYRLNCVLRKVSDNSEILRFEGEFDYPSTMNDLLLRLVEEASAALKSKLTAKKLLPFLNVTTSPAAYLAFAEGSLALDQSTNVGIQEAVPLLEKAVNRFEQAIQQDYNYVPAYLGMSEALAALAALTRTNGYAQKARLQMEKAKLLNPVLTKVKAARIEKYLKAKKEDFCNSHS